MPGAETAEKARTGPAPLATNYYYRAGRAHNQLPRAPLCSDQGAQHNEGANVLFSDGNIKWLRKAEWEALGFKSLEDIAAARSPGMSGMGPGYGGKGRKGGGDE